MTDDDLDAALSALSLEEPPADLHARILAATIYALPAPIPTWELWAIASAIVLVAAALCGWLTAGHAAVPSLDDGLERIVHFASPSLVSWLAVGISSVWWISSLTLMPRPVVKLYNSQA